MLILLPPSEGKASGGDGPPLDLAALSAPALTPARRPLVRAVQRAARLDAAGLRAALGLGPTQAAEVAKDAVLTTAPTLPTMSLYTGIVYDNLGYASLHGSAKRRANASLVVASALFGLLRPADRVPSYRLSAQTSLAGVGGLPTLWRPVLEPELAAAGGLIIDLRSAPYAALARVPHAIQVRVLRDTDGQRAVVSHDNKYTKGKLARVLCEQGARTVQDVAAAGRTVADDVEVDGARVDLVLHGLASQRG